MTFAKVELRSADSKDIWNQSKDSTNFTDISLFNVLKCMALSNLHNLTFPKFLPFLFHSLCKDINKCDIIAYTNITISCLANWSYPYFCLELTWLLFDSLTHTYLKDSIHISTDNSKNPFPSSWIKFPGWFCSHLCQIYSFLNAVIILDAYVSVLLIRL